MHCIYSWKYRNALAARLPTRVLANHWQRESGRNKYSGSGKEEKPISIRAGCKQSGHETVKRA